MLNLFNFVQLVRKLVSASLFEIPCRSFLSLSKSKIKFRNNKCSYGLIGKFANVLMYP